MTELPVFRLPITSKPSAPAITPTFKNCLGTFKIDSPARHPMIESPSPMFAAAPQVETTDTATATSERHGSITLDRENQRPTHEWNSLDEFYAWRLNEELAHGIELLLSSSNPRPADGKHWQVDQTYSCSRQGTGGKTKHAKKYTADKITKRPSSKRTGCGCRVRIKTYHHVSTVLGWYEPEHDHAVGVANLMYTRLRDSTRGYALKLLRTNMSPKEVFRRVHRARGKHGRGHYIYITMQDIYRLRKIVKEEAAPSASSDSPISEDEEPSIQPEDASDTGSTSEVDEQLDVLDEQSDGYADPGILTSPPPGSATHLYNAGAATDVKFAVSPVMPAASVDPTISPASSMAPAISPAVPAASIESAALPVVPGTQATHYFAPPLPVPPPHDLPAGWYMPPPVVVNIPNPPYQMTLYPLYPVYFPSSTR